mgnify:FL=1
MVAEQLVIIGVSAVIGGMILSSARSRYDRAQTLSALVTDGGDTTAAAGTETRSIEGAIEVDRPAEPERRPPDHYSPEQPNDAAPALWAWRVQRERDTGQGADTWKTIDSGLAVGEFSVRDDWERVRIDSESVRPEEIDDPFTADRLFLGDPEIDEYVEEYSGSVGDVGPFEDVEVSVSVGTETTTPNKYQATVIRDGDEMLARGRVEDRGEESVLRDEEGIEIAIGDLSTRAEEMYNAARNRAILGASVLVLGVGAAIASLV